MDEMTLGGRVGVTWIRVIDEPRDLAIIDLLASTGMRVGEFLLMLRMKDCKLVELK